MGAPPPSSGLIYARVEILDPGQATPSTADGEDFWGAVTRTLDKWGRQGTGLRWERYPPEGTDPQYTPPQLGYDVYMTGAGFQASYKELRAALTKLLSDSNVSIDEWKRVKYGYIGETPQSLQQIFPPPP